MKEMSDGAVTPDDESPYLPMTGISDEVDPIIQEYFDKPTWGFRMQYVGTRRTYVVIDDRDSKPKVIAFLKTEQVDILDASELATWIIHKFRFESIQLKYMLTLIAVVFGTMIPLGLFLNPFLSQFDELALHFIILPLMLPYVPLLLWVMKKPGEVADDEVFAYRSNLLQVLQKLMEMNTEPIQLVTLQKRIDRLSMKNG